MFNSIINIIRKKWLNKMFKLGYEKGWNRGFSIGYDSGYAQGLKDENLDNYCYPEEYKQED